MELLLLLYNIKLVQSILMVTSNWALVGSGDLSGIKSASP